MRKRGSARGDDFIDLTESGSDFIDLTESGSSVDDLINEVAPGDRALDPWLPQLPQATRTHSLRVTRLEQATDLAAEPDRRPLFGPDPRILWPRTHDPVPARTDRSLGKPKPPSFTKRFFRRR